MKRVLLCTLVAFPPLARAEALAPVSFAQESVDGLIQQGRELLAAGKVQDAQAAFERAAELDKSSPKTRVWVVRGWIAQGKYDDALNAADELKTVKAPEADVDYLFGLTFLALAKASMASGGNAYTQSQLEDSFMHLQRATKANATRFPDAWLPLAEAAWYAQALPEARAAAERAVQLEPKSPAAEAMLGKIAFSQYIASADDAGAQDTHWKAALDAFKKAIELYGNPSDASSRGELASVHSQCGDLHAWKKDTKAASESYAAAMGSDPGRVDFPRVRELLGESFTACLAEGTQRFKKSHASDDPAFATLSWWHGLALFDAAKWSDSEAAFRRAVALWPAYTNSWYYVFRCLASQQEYEQTIDTLRKYLELDPEGLATTMAADAARNVSVISGLIAWCADPEKHMGDVLNSDAALLCDVLTRIEPENARHWNNLGLFVRDEGDALKSGHKKVEPGKLEAIWERAYVAYRRALDLAPGDPNYLNDTAVMLHYYLKRDFEQAMALYEKSAKRAEEELTRKDLSTEDRAVIEIAKRDSNNNIKRLKKYLEKLAAGENVDPNSIE